MKLKVFKKDPRFVYNNYSILYEDLFEKAGKVKMSVNMLKILFVEIYKTMNTMNPESTNKIFKVKENKKLVTEQYRLNLETPEWNQVNFGTKNLKVHGPEIWNSLLFYIILSENLIIFEILMKN